MPRITTNSLWFMNGHITIQLSQADNADGLSIVEHLLPADFGPPLHIHRAEDETFYILEGGFRFQLGDNTRLAKPGDTIHLPQGVPHGFKVLSEAGGRCLTFTRGGFEEMLRAASRPAPSAILPYQVEPSPAMQEQLAILCAANGIDLIGPPID